MPPYQRSAPAALGVIGPDSGGGACGAPFCREVPDVSAVGDPHSGYVIDFAGHWLIDGGTSAAAPLWAALTALIDGDRACGGHALGFVDPALYEIAGGAYAANFNGVPDPSPSTGATTDDGLAETTGLFPIGPAYDMATGLGTPRAGALAASLCALSARAPSTGRATLSGPRRRPRLELTIAAGTSSPGLTQIAIRLPQWLRLARGTRRGLSIACGVAGVRATQAVDTRQLTIAFWRLVPRVAITLTRPLLRARGRPRRRALVGLTVGEAGAPARTMRVWAGPPRRSRPARRAVG
jgi:hypothetical protein